MASGEIGFPDYMELIHGHFLYNRTTPYSDKMNYSIIDLMNAAQSEEGNPYSDKSAYNPNAALTLADNSPLKRMSDQFSASKTIIDALDADSDWQAFVDAAYAKRNSFADIDFLENLDSAVSGLIDAVDSVLSGSNVQSLVDSFESNKKARFQRDVSLWAAGMADINAVNTSSFIIGLALRQKEFSDQVDLYEKELKYNIYNSVITNSINAFVKANVLRVSNQDNLVLSGAEAMAKIHFAKAELEHQLIRTKAEIERLTMIAMQEKEEQDLMIDVEYSKWDLETYMYGANVLASISGAGVGRSAPVLSRKQSALSGAIAGASIGAKLGWVGAVIGSVAGALLGWAMGED